MGFWTKKQFFCEFERSSEKMYFNGIISFTKTGIILKKGKVGLLMKQIKSTKIYYLKIGNGTYNKVVRRKCHIGKSNCANSLLGSHLDDLKFFNRVLQTEEIQREMNIRRPKSLNDHFPLNSIVHFPPIKQLNSILIFFFFYSQKLILIYF